MSDSPQPDLIETGRQLLQSMRFTPTQNNYGYPRLCSVPSSTRAESDREVRAIQAFLDTTSLVRNKDYTWSYRGQGDQGVLNFKEAPLITLVRLLETPAIEKPSVPTR